MAVRRRSPSSIERMRVQTLYCVLVPETSDSPKHGGKGGEAGKTQRTHPFMACGTLKAKAANLTHSLESFFFRNPFLSGQLPTAAAHSAALMYNYGRSGACRRLRTQIPQILPPPHGCLEPPQACHDLTTSANAKGTCAIISCCTPVCRQAHGAPARSTPACGADS
jgi:hypothetical protein